MRPYAGISLKSVLKTYRYDQDKVRSPQETIAWVKERFLRSGKNILLKTLRIDTGRLGIPVYISLCGKDASSLTGTRKQMGKGATPEQSEASALMELAERFSFFSYMKEKEFTVMTWKDVEGTALPLEHLLVAIHDEKTSPELARAFLMETPLRWVPAYNLTRKVDEWLPIDWFYVINEYNGPAAGNTIEEAVLQSLCEVVERHVGTVISYGKLSAPAIDLSTARSEPARELIGKYLKEGIELFVRDFSLNTGIPSVGVLAYDPKTFPEKSEIVFTVGTTSDPEKSLCRALTEVAQLAGDFESRTTYKPTFPKYKTFEEASYMTSSQLEVSLQDLPSIADDDFLVEIERAVESLNKNMGWEVFVVNVTNPLLEIPAVYTIIPGAHFLDRASGTDFPQHMARVLISFLDAKSLSLHMERLIKYFGERYDLLFFLGYAKSLRGETEDALKLYSKALSETEDPEEKANIVINIASCYKDIGDYGKALDYLESIESDSLRIKEFHHLKGVCFYYLKEFEKALDAFGKVIEIDPSSAIDYANIASTLKEMGHTEEAIAFYELALSMDPTLGFAKDNLKKLKEM